MERNTVLRLKVSSFGLHFFLPVLTQLIAHCSSSEYPMPIDCATDEGDVPMKARTSSSKKRLSQGYIPRPQNAFMLFRADFIKTRHIPGSAETSNQSLSKYIGELIFTYELV